MQVYYNGDLQDFINEALSLNILSCNIHSGEVWIRKTKMACISSRGYIVGTVHMNKVRKQIKAHQVIWMRAFGRYDNMIDHIDRNKLNNCVNNLRLVTDVENSRNRRNYGGENNPSAKINMKIALEIRKLHKSGMSYDKIKDYFKISKTLVATIVRGESWV